MDTQQKLRMYLFGFLAFCVLSSKHIIIYNEETLVALCFFCFVFFISHYFGTTITESLNERSEIIHQELQNFLNIKEKTLNKLKAEYQKISELPLGVQNLALFTTTELQRFNSNTQKALTNIFIHQIGGKFKTLSFSKLVLQQNLQDLLSRNILSNVLVAYQKNSDLLKGIPMSQKTIQKTIQLLLKSK